jgi:hypothetical protein
MYFETKDDSGNLTIRDQSGAIIPEDYENQKYCDFLTWKSHQDRFNGPDFLFLSGPCFFFSDLECLARHCKERGIMLHANPPRVDAAPFITIGDHSYTPAGQRVIGHRGTDYFMGLCRTLASKKAGDEEAKDRIAPWKSNIYVSFNLGEKMRSDLPDDMSTARRLSSWPITRSFVYIDVSDFTRTHPGCQALIVNSIQAVVNNSSLWHYGYARDLCQQIEARLCIGDGYIYVFQKPEAGTFFAAYLARLIEELAAADKLPVAFHFRMGVHVGLVFCFWDKGRENWNYIGDGINGGNRVLEAIGKEMDDVVFISGSVRRELMARNNSQSPFPQILRCLHNRGRKADKHGNLRRVYELNHSDLIPRNEMPPDLDL